MGVKEVKVDVSFCSGGMRVSIEKEALGGAFICRFRWVFVKDVMPMSMAVAVCWVTAASGGTATCSCFDWWWCCFFPSSLDEEEGALLYQYQPPPTADSVQGDTFRNHNGTNMLYMLSTYK